MSINLSVGTNTFNFHWQSQTHTYNSNRRNFKTYLGQESVEYYVVFPKNGKVRRFYKIDTAAYQSTEVEGLYYDCYQRTFTQSPPSPPQLSAFSINIPNNNNVEFKFLEYEWLGDNQEAEHYVSGKSHKLIIIREGNQYTVSLLEKRSDLFKITHTYTSKEHPKDSTSVSWIPSHKSSVISTILPTSQVSLSENHSFISRRSSFIGVALALILALGLVGGLGWGGIIPLGHMTSYILVGVGGGGALGFFIYFCVRTVAHVTSRR